MPVTVFCQHYRALITRYRGNPDDLDIDEETQAFTRYYSDLMDTHDFLYLLDNGDCLNLDHAEYDGAGRLTFAVFSRVYSPVRRIRVEVMLDRDHCGR